MALFLADFMREESAIKPGFSFDPDLLQATLLEPAYCEFSDLTCLKFFG